MKFRCCKLKDADGYYLVFAVKRGSAENFLWKATIRICILRVWFLLLFYFFPFIFFPLSIIDLGVDYLILSYFKADLKLVRTPWRSYIFFSLKKKDELNPDSYRVLTLGQFLTLHKSLLVMLNGLDDDPDAVLKAYNSSAYLDR